MQQRARAKPQTVPRVLLKRSSTSAMPSPNRYCKTSTSREVSAPSGITSQRFLLSPKGRAKKKPNGTKMSMFISSLRKAWEVKLRVSCL